MDILGHFPISTLRHVGGEVRRGYPSLPPMLCNARSIDNKTVVTADKQVDPARVMETLAKGGETVPLTELAPPGLSILHWTRGGGA